MAILTTSQQVGSLIDTIAEITDERLSLTLIDNHIHVTKCPITSWL